jgi:hypothetical protein
MTETVREALERELGADKIHGITISRRLEDRVFLVIARSCTWEDIEECEDRDVPVWDLRTVCVDLQDNAVRVTDNGMWIPRESEITESLTSLLAVSTTNLEESNGDQLPPRMDSCEDGLEPELLLEREIEEESEQDWSQHIDKMRDHTGVDPSREWGYGAGPPPEIERLEERLREIGEDPSDHVSRLVWGKKEPMDREPRPVEELTGNYGVELLPKSSGLIALDIDYPEHFPADFEIPDTLEVSSPHGGEQQRHVVVRCDSKSEIANELGAWAVQAVEWGDLWIGDRFLVGPGSQLSEWGCSEGEHDRGERGGCPECEDPEGGYYEIINDSEIADVSPEWVLGLIQRSRTGETEIRDEETAPDPPENCDQDPDRLECDSCGALLNESEAHRIELGSSERVICEGGCET